MNNFPSEPKRHVLFSSAGRNWNSLEADLVQIPAGQAQARVGNCTFSVCTSDRPLMQTVWWAARGDGGCRNPATLISSRPA